MRKTFFIPAGITAAAAIGCIAAIAFSSSSAQYETAYVYQDGKVIAEIPLDGSSDGTTLTVKGENGMENVIEVQDQKIHMKSAACPDQLCVKMGWRTHADTPIVCLPAKVVIEIKGDTHEADAEIN